MLTAIPPIINSLSGSVATSIGATAPTAHQTIGVNSAGTAWALRTPGWLDTAQTWFAAQTFNKQDTSILTFIPSDTTNTGNFYFTHATGAGANPVSGLNDEVWHWGYNVARGGGSVNPLRSAVYWTVESFFENAGYSGPESHWVFYPVGGPEQRLMSFAGAQDGSRIDLSTRFDNFAMYGKGMTSFVQVSTTNTGSFAATWDILAGNLFRFNANNVALWQMRNAANTAYIGLPYINASDLLAVPTQIQPTFSGTATTPCYAMNADATTGMYSGGAGVIIWTCAGAQKMQLGGTTLALSSGIGLTLTGSVTIANTNSDLFLDASSGHAIRIRPNGSSQVVSFDSNGLNMTDAKNILFSTTTGTQIGTSASQKFAWHGATPVAQYSTTGTTIGFAAGAGSAVDSAATFTGNTGTTGYTIGDIVRAMKLKGMMAA